MVVSQSSVCLDSTTELITKLPVYPEMTREVVPEFSLCQIATLRVIYQYSVCSYATTEVFPKFPVFSDTTKMVFPIVSVYLVTAKKVLEFPVCPKATMVSPQLICTAKGIFSLVCPAVVVICSAMVPLSYLSLYAAGNFLVSWVEYYHIICHQFSHFLTDHLCTTFPMIPPGLHLLPLHDHPHLPSLIFISSTAFKQSLFSSLLSGLLITLLRYLPDLLTC